MQQNLLKRSNGIAAVHLKRHESKASTTARVLVPHNCHIHNLSKLLKITLNFRLCTCLNSNCSYLLPNTESRQRRTSQTPRHHSGQWCVYLNPFHQRTADATQSLRTNCWLTNCTNQALKFPRRFAITVQRRSASYYARAATKRSNSLQERAPSKCCSFGG